MDHGPADLWRAVLRSELTAAMRAREQQRVAVVRSLLAAIDNAEAAHVDAAPAVQDGVVAGGVAGLGAGEVARRALTGADLQQVVADEADRRRTAADELVSGGRADRGDELLAEIAVIEGLRELLASAT